MDAQDRASRACNDAHEWHELKAEREAKRKADAAPDLEKLLAFAILIQGVKMPAISNGALLLDIAIKIDNLAAWIRGKAGEL